MVKTSPSNAGNVGWIPNWRLNMPQGLHSKPKTEKQKQRCNKFNKDLKNGPHQEKKKNLKKKSFLMWLSCFHRDQRKGWGNAGYPKDFQGGLKICRREASRALSLVTLPSSSDWSASWRPAGPLLHATRASLTCSPGRSSSQG